VIGGKLNAAGANARLGKGDFLVAEADESDASFLLLTPVISVVTNIDADHMETYGHDFARLKQSFVDFLQHLPFYGVAVLCDDDKHVRSIMPLVSKQIVRYGFSESANVRAENIHADDGRMSFDVVRVNGTTSRISVVLNLPGRHNVLNALAAIAVATEVGVSDDAIIKALAEFKGVGRRFQRYGELTLPNGGTATIVDDYGHHPVEMAATIAAARGAFPDKTPGAGLPTPSVHADAGLFRGLREGALHRRCPAAGRGVRGRGGAHCRRRRPLPGARPAGGGQDRAGVRGEHRGHAGGDPVFGSGWRRGDHHGCRQYRRRAGQTGEWRGLRT
jgi:hypothetical protein